MRVSARPPPARHRPGHRSRRKGKPPKRPQPRQPAPLQPEGLTSEPLSHHLVRLSSGQEGWASDAGAVGTGHP